MACGCGRQTEQAVEPVDAIGIIGAMEVEVASLKEAMEIASTKTVADEEAAAVRCAAIVRYIVSTL